MIVHTETKGVGVIDAVYMLWNSIKVQQNERKCHRPVLYTFVYNSCMSRRTTKNFTEHTCTWEQRSGRPILLLLLLLYLFFVVVLSILNSIIKSNWFRLLHRMSSMYSVWSLAFFFFNLKDNLLQCMFFLKHKKKHTFLNLKNLKSFFSSLFYFQRFCSGLQSMWDKFDWLVSPLVCTFVWIHVGIYTVR